MELERKLIEKIFELFDSRGYPPPVQLIDHGAKEILGWIISDHDIIRLKVFLNGLGRICHDMNEEELTDSLNLFIIDLIMEDAYFYLENLPRSAEEISSALFATMLVLIEKVPENTLVPFTSRYIDSLLDDVPHFSFKLEALKSLNEILNFCTSGERKQILASVAQKMEPIFELLFIVGDYEFQVGVMETTFRILSKKMRAQFAKEMLPDQEMLTSFSVIRGNKFEEDCRQFLIYLNSKLELENRVFSCLCLTVKFGSFYLQMPQDQKLWVDFNRGSNRITMLCQVPSSSRSISQESGTPLETISIGMDKVLSYTCSEGKDQTTVVKVELAEDVADLNPNLLYASGSQLELTAASQDILPALRAMFDCDAKSSVVKDPLFVKRSVLDGSMEEKRKRTCDVKKQERFPGSYQQSNSSQFHHSKTSVVAEPLYLGAYESSASELSLQNSQVIIPDSMPLSDDEVLPSTYPVKGKKKRKTQTDDSGISMAVSSSVLEAPEKSPEQKQRPAYGEDIRGHCASHPGDNTGFERGELMDTQPEVATSRMEDHENNQSSAIEPGKNVEENKDKTNEKVTPPKLVTSHSKADKSSSNKMVGTGLGSGADHKSSQRSVSCSPEGTEMEMPEAQVQSGSELDSDEDAKKMNSVRGRQRTKKKTANSLAMVEADDVDADTDKKREDNKSSKTFPRSSEKKKVMSKSPLTFSTSVPAGRCSKKKAASCRDLQGETDVYEFASDAESPLPSFTLKKGKTASRQDVEMKELNIVEIGSPLAQSSAKKQKGTIQNKKLLATSLDGSERKCKKMISTESSHEKSGSKNQKMTSQVAKKPLKKCKSDSECNIVPASPLIGMRSLRKRKPVNYNEDRISITSFDSNDQNDVAVPKKTTGASGTDAKTMDDGYTEDCRSGMSSGSKHGKGDITQKKITCTAVVPRKPIDTAQGNLSQISPRSNGKKSTSQDENEQPDVSDHDPYDFDMECKFYSVSHDQPTQSYRAVVANVTYSKKECEQTIWEQEGKTTPKCGFPAKKQGPVIGKQRSTSVSAARSGSPEVSCRATPIQSSDDESPGRENSPLGIFQSDSQNKSNTRRSANKKSTSRKKAKKMYKRKSANKTKETSLIIDDGSESLSDYELIIGSPLPKTLARNPLTMTPLSLKNKSDDVGSFDGKSTEMGAVSSKAGKGIKGKAPKCGKQNAETKKDMKKKSSAESDSSDLEDSLEMGTSQMLEKAAAPSSRSSARFGNPLVFSAMYGGGCKGGYSADSPAAKALLQTEEICMSPVDFFSDSDGGYSEKENQREMTPKGKMTVPSKKKTPSMTVPFKKTPSSDRKALERRQSAEDDHAFELSRMLSQESMDNLSGLSLSDSKQSLWNRGEKAAGYPKGKNAKKLKTTSAASGHSSRSSEISDERSTGKKSWAEYSPYEASQEMMSSDVNVSKRCSAKKKKTRTQSQTVKPCTPSAFAQMEGNDDTHMTRKRGVFGQGKSQVTVTPQSMATPSRMMLNVIQEVLNGKNSARKPCDQMAEDSVDSDDDKSLQHQSDDEQLDEGCVESEPPSQTKPTRSTLKRKFDAISDSNSEDEAAERGAFSLGKPGQTFPGRAESAIPPFFPLALFQTPVIDASEDLEEKEGTDVHTLASIRIKKKSKQQPKARAVKATKPPENLSGDLAVVLRTAEQSSKRIREDFFPQIFERLNKMEKNAEASKRLEASFVENFKEMSYARRRSRTSDQTGLRDIKNLFGKLCEKMDEDGHNTEKKTRDAWKKEMTAHFSQLRKESLRQIQQQELVKLRKCMSATLLHI